MPITNVSRQDIKRLFAGTRPFGIVPYFKFLMNGSNSAIWTNTEQSMRRKFGFFYKEHLTKRVTFRRNTYFMPAVSARYDPKSHRDNFLFTTGPGNTVHGVRGARRVCMPGWGFEENDSYHSYRFVSQF